MVDPISITSLILQIPDLAAKLYDYGKNVKDAKREFGLLYAELLALQAVLNQIKAEGDKKGTRSNRGLYDLLSSQPVLNALVMADTILKTILNDLNKLQASERRTLKSLTWPLGRSEIYKRITELERLKSTFVMVLMNDGL